MEEHDPIGKVRNRHGQIQPQIKFNITDGRFVLSQNLRIHAFFFGNKLIITTCFSNCRTSVKVTFWDEFAELFADVIRRDLEHPLILIIGSCRVTMWDGMCFCLQ